MVHHFLDHHPGLNPFDDNDPPEEFRRIKGPQANEPPYKGLEPHRRKFEETDECDDSTTLDASNVVQALHIPLHH